MNFWKNISKKNLVMIGGSIVLLIIIIGVLLGHNTDNDSQDNDYQENREYKEEKYTMYLKINPLVKFEFSEGYYVCGDDENKNVCSDKTSEITNFVLVNDDAKEMYKDVKINGLNLVDALVNIYDLTKDKGIKFDTFEIVSNYQFDNEELEFEIKNKAKNKSDLNITAAYKDVLDEESVVEKLEDDIYYNVTFDSNGGSNFESINVKDGFSVTEPSKPERKGYEFVEWQLDGKKYDFSSEVSKDITLIAKWKKEVKDNTNDKVDTNNKVEETDKENTSNNKGEDNKNNSSISNDSISNNNSSSESNKDKIKLSDNIKVTVGTEYVEKGCYFVIFADNFQTVFPDAKLNSSSSYNSVSYWAGTKSDSVPGEVSEEELSEKWSSLSFNTGKENQLVNLLKKYSSGNHAGIKNLKYAVDNHRITFTYDYLDFDKTSAHKEIQKALSGSLKFNGTCGGGMSTQETLTKDLCNEYNLSCE